MFSDGNILFTGMQYVAGITPDKKVVWRIRLQQQPPARRINPNKKVVWVLQDWQTSATPPPCKSWTIRAF